jgi:hypothetical protein
MAFSSVVSTIADVSLQSNEASVSSMFAASPARDDLLLGERTSSIIKTLDILYESSVVGDLLLAMTRVSKKKEKKKRGELFTSFRVPTTTSSTVAERTNQNAPMINYSNSV